MSTTAHTAYSLCIWRKESGNHRWAGRVSHSISLHTSGNREQSYLHSGTRLELVRGFFFELYIFSACISSRSSFPAPRIIPLTKTKNRPTSYLGSAICFQWFNHIFRSFDLVWNISLLPRPSCLEYPSCALSSGKSSMHLCFVGGLWKLLTANTCRHACMVIKCWS